MMLGFGWINNHCAQVSGCGFIIDNINYADYLYSSLFDCISFHPYEHEITPTVFTLYQNHPNPFNPSTKIGYQLAKNSHVKITIYNNG